MRVLEKTLENELFSELIRAIIMSTVYLLFSSKITQSFGEDSINGWSVVIPISLVITISYYVLIKLIKIITKPICLEIDIINRKTGKITCVCYDQENNFNSMEASINIINTNSFWKRVAHHYLRNKKIALIFKIKNNYDIVVLQAENYFTGEFEYDGTGFKYNISDSVLDNLLRDNEQSIKFNFIAESNRDIEEIRSEYTFDLNPYIEIQNGNSFFINKFIKIDYIQESMKIRYTYD